MLKGKPFDMLPSIPASGPQPSSPRGLPPTSETTARQVAAPGRSVTGQSSAPLVTAIENGQPFDLTWYLRKSLWGNGFSLGILI